MAEFTPNYNLYKPNRNDSEPVDTTLSDNFTAIDSELKRTADEVSTVKNELETKTTAIQGDLDNKTMGIQEQLNALVVGGDSSPAVSQALAGTPFVTLKEKLDDTDAIVGQKSPVQFDTITVRIPSDFPTLQEAIDKLSERKPKQGRTITLQMESGYQPSKGIKVSDGDYSHFVISSVDAEVAVASDFTGNFLQAYRAKTPRLSCLVNMNYLGLAGVWLDDQSDGFVSSGAGVKNCYDRSLYVNKTSRVWAEGSIWTGGRCQGLWVSRASTAHVTSADFSDCGEVNPTDVYGVSIHISRQSRVYGLYLKVLNSKGTAIKCQRGSIFSAPEGDFSGAAENGVQITGGSIAYVEKSKIENIGQIGLISQCAQVHAQFTTISGKVGNTSDGVVCENAGTLDIDQATITGFGRHGVYATRAGTVNASTVTISNSGSNGAISEQGSTINLRSASVTGSATKDLSVIRGAFISALDCTTSNGVGKPVVGDSNVTAFNAIQGSQGVIWA